MGDVINLRRGSKPVEAAALVRPAPGAAASWNDQFWDLGAWRVSKKGNNYIKIEGRYVTVFRNGDWWWWSISEEGWTPWYSDGGFESEREARRDAARELGDLLVERNG
jgi:hypothetical protein